MFVIFINDLPEVTHSMAQMFADDTKVYTEVNDIGAKEQLQNDIDNLVNWSNNWQLRFNAKKCKVLHIERNNPGYEYFMSPSSNNTDTPVDKLKLESHRT